MSSFSAKSLVHAVRKRATRRLIGNRLARRPVTIISDDCWGGRLYAHFDLPCRSPFINLGFHGSEYLSFLENLHNPDAFRIIGQEVSNPRLKCPVLHLPHARIFGLHYRSLAELRQRFERRVKTMVWDNLRFKIDLGRDGYTDADIDRWNRLKLPCSIAIHPPRSRFINRSIHRRLCLPDWKNDGSQFKVTIRACDLIPWINSGTGIRLSHRYRWTQWLFLEENHRDRMRELLLANPSRKRSFEPII